MIWRRRLKDDLELALQRRERQLLPTKAPDRSVESLIEVVELLERCAPPDPDPAFVDRLARQLAYAPGPIAVPPRQAGRPRWLLPMFSIGAAAVLLLLLVLPLQGPSSSPAAVPGPGMVQLSLRDAELRAEQILMRLADPALQEPAERRRLIDEYHTLIGQAQAQLSGEARQIWLSAQQDQLMELAGALDEYTLEQLADVLPGVVPVNSASPASEQGLIPPTAQNSIPAAAETTAAPGASQPAAPVVADSTSTPPADPVVQLPTATLGGQTQPGVPVLATQGPGASPGPAIVATLPASPEPIATTVVTGPEEPSSTPGADQPGLPTAVVPSAVPSATGIPLPTISVAPTQPAAPPPATAVPTVVTPPLPSVVVPTPPQPTPAVPTLPAPTVTAALPTQPPVVPTGVPTLPAPRTVVPPATVVPTSVPTLPTVVPPADPGPSSVPTSGVPIVPTPDATLEPTSVPELPTGLPVPSNVPALPSTQPQPTPDSNVPPATVMPTVRPEPPVPTVAPVAHPPSTSQQRLLQPVSGAV